MLKNIIITIGLCIIIFISYWIWSLQNKLSSVMEENSTLKIALEQQKSIISTQRNDIESEKKKAEENLTRLTSSYELTIKRLEQKVETIPVISKTPEERCMNALNFLKNYNY